MGRPGRHAGPVGDVQHALHRLVEDPQRIVAQGRGRQRAELALVAQPLVERAPGRPGLEEPRADRPAGQAGDVHGQGGGWVVLGTREAGLEAGTEEGRRRVPEEAVQRRELDDIGRHRVEGLLEEGGPRTRPAPAGPAPRPARCRRTPTGPRGSASPVRSSARRRAGGDGRSRVDGPPRPAPRWPPTPTPTRRARWWGPPSGPPGWCGRRDPLAPRPDGPGRPAPPPAATRAPRPAGPDRRAGGPGPRGRRRPSPRRRRRTGPCRGGRPPGTAPSGAASTRSR